jgi:hypothetical protein
MITLEEAQERIAHEKKVIEELFQKYGYTRYGEFSEEPDIEFWVKEGKYELKGVYKVPRPCISIDEDFCWMYEDETGYTHPNLKGTGAETLAEFLIENV